MDILVENAKMEADRERRLVIFLYDEAPLSPPYDVTFVCFTSVNVAW